MGGIATSRFKVDSAGCGGRFACSRFSGQRGFFGVFTTSFVLYLNELPSEALSSTSSIIP